MNRTFELTSESHLLIHLKDLLLFILQLLHNIIIYLFF